MYHIQQKSNHINSFRFYIKTIACVFAMQPFIILLIGIATAKDTIKPTSKFLKDGDLKNAADKAHYNDSEVLNRQLPLDSEEAWVEDINPTNESIKITKSPELDLKEIRNGKYKRTRYEPKSAGPAGNKFRSVPNKEFDSTGEEKNKRNNDKKFSRERAQILKTGKELIKRNTELIKNLEDGLKNIQGKDESNNSKETIKNKEEIGIKASITETETKESGKSWNKSSAEEGKSPNITKTVTKDSIELRIPVKNISNQSNSKNFGLQTGSVIKKDENGGFASVFNRGTEVMPGKVATSMKKLSDLFFKSSMMTKNEILTKEDSAALIDSNNKIKSIMGQLQKLFDTNSTILNKFLDGGKDGMEPQTEEKDKPKDVLKYQVIEVTEKQK